MHTHIPIHLCVCVCVCIRHRECSGRIHAKLKRLITCGGGLKKKKRFLCIVYVNVVFNLI